MAQRFGVNTINRSDPTEERPVVGGYVSTVKPAPTSFADPLWVIVPGYSTQTPYLCKWGALHGEVLPAQGAEVQVAFDDNDVPRVVWWDGESNGLSVTVKTAKMTAEGKEGSLTFTSGILTAHTLAT